MSFGSPLLLVSLLLVPATGVIYWRLERRRAARSAAWSKLTMLPNIVRRPPRRLKHVPVGLFLLGLSFLLVGFARPQTVSRSVSDGGPTVVVAVDLSGSMAAADVAPTRIRAARQIALTFLHELPLSFRVGVVTFADRTRVVVPPTRDRASAVAGVPHAITPLSGTALGDGISEALALVVDADGRSYPHAPHPPGAVLLLSDGGQSAGGTNPTEAANTAYADGIPIDSIAVGTRAGTVTQPLKVDGWQTFTQIAVPVEPATLRAVARATGGVFYPSGTTKGFAQVYERLGAQAAPGRRAHELSAATSGVALVLILAAVALSALWFGRAA